MSAMSHAAQRDFHPATYIVLNEEDYRVLTEAEFGAPGLVAIEAVGPFVDIQASGPLVTVHDSTVEPHLGIGHHRHRYNERFFYIMAGQLDHDDSLNHIQGHMEPGDVGLFTEGKLGMLHSEWNHGDVATHAYILVYSTEPVPERASFTVLHDADAPRYNEGEGVRTKELLGANSGLRVHGDIRLFTDSTIRGGWPLVVTLSDREGGLLSIQQGQIELDGQRIGKGATILLPPAEGERSLTVRAVGKARVLRVVHGPGYGFVRMSDRARLR